MVDLRAPEAVSDEFCDELCLRLVCSAPGEGERLCRQSAPETVRQQPEDVDEPPEGQELADQPNRLPVVNNFEPGRALWTQPEVLDEPSDIELTENVKLAHRNLEMAQLNNRETTRVRDPDTLPPSLQIQNGDELERKRLNLGPEIREKALGKSKVARHVGEKRRQATPSETLEDERPRTPPATVGNQLCFIVGGEDADHRRDLRFGEVGIRGSSEL